MRTKKPKYVTRRKLPDGTREREWSVVARVQGADGVVRRISQKLPSHVTTEQEAASLARVLVEQLRRAESRTATERFLDSIKRKRTCASGEEVLAAYLASAKGTGFEKSSRKNAGDMRTIWREGCGLDAGSVGFDKLCCRETMEKFVALRQGRERPDYDTRRPANRTINSMMNHARCLLSRGSIERRLRGLDLGDWQGFCIPYLPTPAKYWTKLEPDVLSAMDAGSLALDDDMRLAYDLARKLGLRVNEIKGARGTWLMPYACESGWGIQICDRPEEGWTQKGTRPRVLPLPLDLCQRLLARRDGDRFVLPGRSETARKLLLDDLSKFVRQYLPERQKTIHELRKQYGSEILTGQGLTAASYSLGHMQQTTTERHYAAYLGTLQVA